MTVRTFILLTALMPLPVVPPSQDAGSEGLVISSPADGSYVTGPVLLQVRPRDPGAVRSVSFFADGQSVCTVARPPFECN